MLGFFRVRAARALHAEDESARRVRPALAPRVLCGLMVPLLGCEALVKLDYRFEDSTLEPDASANGGSTSGAAARGGQGGGSAGSTSLAPQTPGAAGSAGASGSGSIGSGCDAGTPPSSCTAASVTLQGSVQQYDTRQSLAGVRVGSVGGPTLTTDASGGFSYPVPPGSTSLALILTQPGDNGVPAFLRTVLQIDDPLSASRAAVTLPSVSHDWRVSVAKACGVLALDASDDDVLQYFNERSTLLVEAGAAGIVSSQITVTVTQGTDSWTNTDPSSSDTAPGARVCFLEQDARGNILGGSASATTELGDFVIFRVRNKAGGGGGDASVLVSDLGSASITFDGAGQTGVVRLGSGW